MCTVLHLILILIWLCNTNVYEIPKQKFGKNNFMKEFLYIY